MVKCRDGFVRQEGKCVKRTLNPTTWFSVKKNNNPFKMWGAWVGAVLYPLLATLYYAINIEGTDRILFFPLYLASWITGVIPSSGMQGFGYFLLFGAISLAIAGFLIGWGIQSMFRRR